MREPRSPSAPGNHLWVKYDQGRNKKLGNTEMTKSIQTSIQICGGWGLELSLIKILTWANYPHGSLAISDSAFSFHLCNSCSTSYLGAPWAFRLITIEGFVVKVNASPNVFPQRPKVIVSFLWKQLGVWPSHIVCFARSRTW